MYHRYWAVFVLSFPRFRDGDGTLIQAIILKRLIAFESLSFFHIRCVVGESLYGSVFMDHHQMNLFIQRVMSRSADLLQSIAS